MSFRLTRRRALASLGCLLGTGLALDRSARPVQARWDNPKVRKSAERGLEWVAKTQSRLGHWTATGQYPTAMTALAGTALLCEGSTTTQGKYAENIRRTVDFLTGRSRANGLIGDPVRDNRYTYGHGFSMLFLSQVLGEEEDIVRREELVNVLTKAVTFSGEAQTPSGGWGYVSSKDGGGFDEGSTTITQVQGLRGCRNAGIPVPKEVIDRAVGYIRDCTLPDGGVAYSSKNRGSSRPAITAAAIACLFNAGQEDSDYVPKLLEYCKKNLSNLQNPRFGHWHYTYYYYSQVMFRQGGEQWETFRDKIHAKLLREQSSDGSWQGNIGPIYITAINLTIMQLERGCLPIYQR